MSLEFEKKLGQELSKHGIDFQYAYMIPGTAFEIDFYIKAPIRSSFLNMMYILDLN